MPKFLKILWSAVCALLRSRPLENLQEEESFPVVQTYVEEPDDTTYITKYSGRPTKRDVVIFGEQVRLEFNEEGSIDYTADEHEQLSTCCASCGERIMIGDPIGAVRRSVDLPENTPISHWRDRPNSCVGCTRCLDNGIADAIGRWLPKAENPLEASAQLLPFDEIAEIGYTEHVDDHTETGGIITDTDPAHFH